MKSKPGQLEIFTDRFVRSYRLLQFLACRVLGDEGRSTVAIQNCWRTASRNPPHFENEAAFRSWLVRVLIDEALVILHESKGADAVTASASTVSQSENAVKQVVG